MKLPAAAPIRFVEAVVAEAWGLVVGGGPLALAVLAAVLGAASSQPGSATGGTGWR